MVTRVLSRFTFAALLTACDGGIPPDPAAVRGETETRFGIQFFVPESRSLDVFDERIDLDKHVSARQSDTIRLYVDKPPPPVDLRFEYAFSSVDDGRFNYVLSSVGSGSGGPSWMLRAGPKDVGGKLVYFVAMIQTAEPMLGGGGPPSFYEAEAVWLSLAADDGD